MRSVIHFFEELGGIMIFVGRIFRTFLTTGGNAQAIVAQIWFVSHRTLSTVLFAGTFVGAIMVIQFGLMLDKYDATTLLGGLNTSATIREVGPLIISFLLAGKIGAFTAAELGNMRVTEQIDAIECLGTDPIQYLIVPRFFAILVSSLILVLLGLMVSLAGATLFANLLYGINYLQFFGSVDRFNDWSTFGAGLFKTLTYAGIVASVACYKGFTARGGARGVGRAVTLSAIYTNFYIVLANYFTTQILTLLRTVRAVWGGDSP